MSRLLLLAGAGEARDLAAGLAAEGREAIASFAGKGRFTGTFDLPARYGGFGGAAGFERYLQREQIGAVLDATHPFAARMSARTAQICRKMRVPYGLLWRAEWQPAAGDDWVQFASEAAAAAGIPAGQCVFVATGRSTLEEFAALEDCEVIARQIGPHSPARFPLPRGRFLQGDAPFSVDEEIALFAELGVSWIVTRNAGGEGARPKLLAARALGLKVAMITRAPPPEGVTLLHTVDEALAWARAHG